MILGLPLAVQEEVIALMIPIIALCIPIVAILAAHQRKMAEIIHSRKQDQGSNIVLGELQEMRQELSELRDRINQQSIQIDQMAYQQIQKPSETEKIRSTITS